MLIYRLPGKEIVQKSGRFIPIEGPLKEGFIVGDFEGEHKFLFNEESDSDKLYFKKDSILNRHERASLVLKPL